MQPTPLFKTVANNLQFDQYVVVELKLFTNQYIQLAADYNIFTNVIYNGFYTRTRQLKIY